MSYCPELKFVREDPDLELLVFAECPDCILPRELSARLVRRFGSGNFRISLQRNVYVIYVDRWAPAFRQNVVHDEDRNGGLGKSLKRQDYKQRSRDVRMAQKVLRA